MRKSKFDIRLLEKLSKKSLTDIDKIRDKIDREQRKNKISSEVAFMFLLDEHRISYKNYFNSLDEKLQNEYRMKQSQLTSKIIKKKVIKTITKKYLFNNITEKPPILDKSILTNANLNAELYFYFYTLENILRKFIINVLDDKKPNWWNSVNNNIKTNVANRKRKEEWNPWFSGRGGSHEVYYTDLSDLSNIIKANTSIFTSYFDKMEGKLNWLTHRIDEIYLIRNNLAHACPIAVKDKDLFKTYFQNIYDIIDNLNNNL